MTADTVTTPAAPPSRRPRQTVRLRTGATHLVVCPWPEAGDAGDRFPVRHPYVEQFYASILGPTAMLMVRRFALALAVRPQGCSIDVEYLAAGLGLGLGRGRNSPLVRSLERVAWHHFGLWVGEDTMAVRQSVPRVPYQVVAKWPVQLQAEHAAALLDWKPGR